MRKAEIRFGNEVIFELAGIDWKPVLAMCRQAADTEWVKEQMKAEEDAYLIRLVARQTGLL